MKPEEQAAAWAKKRQREYMKAYREKNRDRIRVQRQAYYREKTQKEKDNGSTQG